MRDGQLFLQYEDAVQRYQESQGRYDKTLELFKRRLAESDSRWDKALKDERNRIIRDVLISAIGLLADRWLLRIDNQLSGQDKAAMELTKKRFENSAGFAVGTAYEDTITSADLFTKFSFPLMILIGELTAPPVAPIGTGTQTIVKVSEYGSKAFEYWRDWYSVQHSDFDAAMQRLIASSPLTDLKILKQIQARIYMECPYPALYSLSPASGAPGTDVNVVLAGGNFPVGSSIDISAGTGVTIVSKPVMLDNKRIRATFRLDANATLGAHDVTVTTSGATSGPQTFTVNPPAPTLTRLNQWSSGGELEIIETLTGTNFVTGATTVAVTRTTGITVVTKSVTSTSIKATFRIARDVKPGTYLVTVTTAGGTSAQPFIVQRADFGPQGKNVKQPR